MQHPPRRPSRLNVELTPFLLEADDACQDTAGFECERQRSLNLRCIDFFSPYAWSVIVHEVQYETRYEC